MFLCSFYICCWPGPTFRRQSVFFSLLKAAVRTTTVVRRQEMKDLTIKKDYYGHYRGHLTTEKGNTIVLFFNEDKGLLVIDLVAENGEGGIELLRRTLDENALLDHTKPSPA